MNVLQSVRMLSCQVLPLLLLLGGTALLAGEQAADTAPKAPAAAAAAGEALEAVTRQGELTMTLRVTPKEPSLSGTLELEVTVEGPAGVAFEAPPFGDAVGDFLVRDYSEKPAGGPNDGSQDNRVRRKWWYRLEPVHSGTHLIRSFAVDVRDTRPGAPAEPQLFESDPLEVEVRSSLGPGVPKLSDLKPMQGPREPQRELWIYIAAGLGALVALAAVLLLARRKRSAAPVEAVDRRTPEEIAQAELAALLKEDLHGSGLFKEFYLRLTGIVREYIERRTGVHAPEQTTEEFLREIRTRGVFPLERSQRLAEFLEAADLVKYAGQTPSARQLEDAIARAQEFIGQSSAFASLPETASVPEAAASTGAPTGGGR